MGNTMERYILANRIDQFREHVKEKSSIYSSIISFQCPAYLHRRQYPSVRCCWTGYNAVRHYSVQDKSIDTPWGWRAKAFYASALYRASCEHTIVILCRVSVAYTEFFL